MKVIAGFVLAFLWVIGLIFFRASLLRVEAGSRTTLPDIAWNWARPQTGKGRRLAKAMALWLILSPALVLLLWWTLF